MKKYKNVRVKRAARCTAYHAQYYHRRDTLTGEEMTFPACIGVPEPFMNPTCRGYKCKCTEYARKRGVSK